MFDGEVDQLLDLLVGNGGFFAQAVDGAAVFDCVEERLLVGHD